LLRTPKECICGRLTSSGVVSLGQNGAKDGEC